MQQQPLSQEDALNAVLPRTGTTQALFLTTAVTWSVTWSVKWHSLQSRDGRRECCGGQRGPNVHPLAAAPCAVSRALLGWTKLRNAPLQRVSQSAPPVYRHQQCWCGVGCSESDTHQNLARQVGVAAGLVAGAVVRQLGRGGGAEGHTWEPNVLCAWLPSPCVTVAGDSGGARPYGVAKSLH